MDIQQKKSNFLIIFFRVNMNMMVMGGCFIAKQTRKIFQSHKSIIRTHSDRGDWYVKEEFFDGFFENIHFECEINSQNGFRIYSCLYT